MKQETMVLTDNQMTNLIYQKVKGDARYKKLVKDEWLITSYQIWQDDSRIDHFTKNINSWMHRHNLPLKVLNFTQFDEQEDPEAIEWEVEITTHD